MDELRFRIRVNGRWYSINAENQSSALNPGVPDSVLSRAKRAIIKEYKESGLLGQLGYTIDPAPYAERALRSEFDDVELLVSTFTPGLVP